MDILSNFFEIHNTMMTPDSDNKKYGSIFFAVVNLISMVPVKSMLPISTTKKDMYIIDVVNGIENLYFWISIPEQKYAMLKNSKEQSPINGMSGKNFAKIAIDSDKIKSVNVPILGNMWA